MAEQAILTALCMLYDGDKLLLQDRVKEDWRGLTFPGGHIEKEESIVRGMEREIWEETGLRIHHPKLCGVKQFQTDKDERYLVMLFKTGEFEGELVSSEEGEMRWTRREELPQCQTASGFFELLRVFDEEELNELAYEREETPDGDRWVIRLY